jgi:hypothetical protein
MVPIGVRYSRSTIAAKVFVEVPLVHWVTSMIFHVSPALGALGVLHPPDPSVLLVLILGAVVYGLVGGVVRELFVAYSGPSSSSSTLRREAK